MVDLYSAALGWAVGYMIGSAIVLVLKRKREGYWQYDWIQRAEEKLRGMK